MVRVGIIGAAGYTAGELIRILVNHPEAEIVFAQSESNAGNRICDIHEGLIGDTEQCFSADAELESVDVVFMCSGHGRSAEFWSANSKPEGLKIIDLAQDFRDGKDGYVYGLPEMQRERIRSASQVANPGCFATAIQLALLPLAAAGKLSDEIQVTAVTGSTGAGARPSATTHFSWRTGNVSSYKEFGHQHLAEICRQLSAVQGREIPPLNFVPVRGDFARGIFASVHTRADISGTEAARLYEEFYNDAAFTFTTGLPVDLKQVVNTNKAVINVSSHSGRLLITSVIDNLLKGASGQAVQNMNLMFGLPEDCALRLKASAF